MDWYTEHLLAVAGASRRRFREGPARQWARWWHTRPVDDLLHIAITQGFVLSTNQLAAAGVTRSAARHAVRIGRWYAPMRGFVGVVDVHAGDPAPPLLARRRHALATAAACLSRPGHIASARSAAILRGLPTVRVPPQPELTQPATANRGDRGAAHLFAAGCSAGASTSWFGVPVMTVERAIVDLARHNRRDGLMAADAALHEQLTTSARLEATLQTAVRWPGVRKARAIIALASPLVESPLESVLRLAMHDDGFPEPELQFEVAGYRADLALPDYGLLIEADGREKYTSDEWWREKEREHVMRQPGWWTERVMPADVYRRWPETSRRLRRSMRPGWRPWADRRIS